MSDIDEGTASFSIRCANADASTKVELQIEPPTGEAQTAALEVKEGVAQGPVKLSTVALWDPNSPNLYQAACRLCQREQIGRYGADLFRDAEKSILRLPGRAACRPRSG